MVKLQKIINIAKGLSHSGSSLSGKAAKGTFWVFFIRIVDRLFKLVRLVILARILSPNDFGVFGVALLVLSILESFTNTGYSQALIHSRKETRLYLNTAWTMGLIRSLVIAVAIFFLAKPASLLFSAPNAENIIRVMGIAVLIQGFNNIAILYLHKELEFKKVFKYQFLGTLIDFIVTVVAVFLLRNVWALVLGLLAGNLTKCIMSYIIEPYRPRIQIIASQTKELFSYGKWITVSGILIFLIIQGDDILVGIMLGAAMLGFYQMAYRISNIPATEITNVISRVGFPLYAKLQSEPERLRSAYSKVLQLVSFITFPISAVILVMAPEFVHIFLGDKWIAIVPVIQVLVLAGLARSMFTTMIPLFAAIGKPKIETRWQVVRFLVIAALVYPLTYKYGIMGTSIAVFSGVLVASIGFFVQTIKVLKLPIRSVLKIIGLPLIGGVIMVLAAYGFKLVLDTYTAAGFIAILAIIMFIFIVMNYLYNRFLGYHISLALKKGLRSFLEE